MLPHMKAAISSNVVFEDGKSAKGLVRALSAFLTLWEVSVSAAYALSKLFIRGVLHWKCFCTVHEGTWIYTPADAC